MRDDFLKNTEGHSLDVEIDEGVIRSLKHSNNGSKVFYYRINTWPNHLCFSGDMGCFVFYHPDVLDMLTFFNHEKVNEGYWAQKVVAGNYKEYCHDYFLDNAADLVYCKHESPNEWGELRGEIESNIDSNEYHAFSDLMSLVLDDFFGEGKDLDFSTLDLCDFGSTDKPTYHFKWACEAIRDCAVKYFEGENNDSLEK